MKSNDRRCLITSLPACHAAYAHAATALAVAAALNVSPAHAQSSPAAAVDNPAMVAQAGPTVGDLSGPTQTAPGALPAKPGGVPSSVNLGSPAPGNAAIRYYKGKGPGRDNVYLHRNEEDYRYLQDPSKSTDIFDPLKYIRLNDSGDVYMSFNGEIRYRFDEQGYNALHVAKGETTKGVLSYGNYPNSRSALYQRYLLGLDTHLTEYADLYLEAIHGQETGHNVASYPGLNRNDIDFGQAFLQFQDNDHLTHVGTRIGRQYVALGNYLQLEPSYAVNIPYPNYDMIRAWADWGAGRVDVFGGHVVNYNYVGTAIFANAGQQDNNTNQIWGLYSSFDLPSFNVLGKDLQSTLDAFYFGYDSKTSSLNPGVYYDRILLNGKNISSALFSGINTQADDTRHTLGVRASGGVGPIDFDYQAAYQVGSYGKYDESAWALNTDTGYNFRGMLLQPRLGLRFNAASGGASGSTIRTYQPMSSNTSYYAENLAIAPTNFINFQPRVTVAVGKYLTVAAYDSIFWRYSENDAVYNGLWQGGGGSNAYAATALNHAKYIGHQPALVASFTPVPHISVTLQLADFVVGQALQKAGGKDTYYMRLTTSFRF